MPSGRYINQKEAARQGGIVSGMTRRERILNQYMKIVEEQGIYKALRICRNKSWKQGYDARIKQELRRLERKNA